MSGKHRRKCHLFAYLARLLLALVIIGCVADWFDDGTIGVVSLIVLALGGIAMTVFAHRVSLSD